MIIEALGISLDDVVRTSYGTGPYTVKSIWGPYWWWTSFEASYDHVTIWSYPVISLGLNDCCVINHIHQDGERWFTDTGDEVFVEKAKEYRPRQLNMFPLLHYDDPRKRPYQFDPAVDYSDQTHVFQCWKCRRDFNGEKWNHGFANPHCPYCNAWVAKTIIIMEPVKPGEKYLSEYQRHIGYQPAPRVAA